MRPLLHALFGAVVGLAAAGLVNILDISPTMMFGVGMLYGSLAQFSADKLFPDRRAATEATGLPDLSSHETIESHPLTNGASR